MKSELLIYTLLLLPNIYFAAKGYHFNLFVCGFFAGMMVKTMLSNSLRTNDRYA